MFCAIRHKAGSISFTGIRYLFTTGNGLYLNTGKFNIFFNIVVGLRVSIKKEGHRLKKVAVLQTALDQ